MQQQQIILDLIVTCDKEWILNNNWQWLAQWLYQEEFPNHFSKPNLGQKMVMVTIWSSAAGLIHYSLLNPRETITSEKYAQQINEMLQKLQCLLMALVHRKGPILLHSDADCTSHNQCFRSWTNGVTKLCLICHTHLTSCQPTTTSSSISTTFCRENASTTSRREKNAFQEFVESWSTDFFFPKYLPFLFFKIFIYF